MTAVPSAWDEFCLIGITNDGGSEVQFAALTEDITAMDFGEKDIEGVANLKGGRITKFTPMTDESVTLKVYPVDVKLDGNGVAQWFHPQSTDDTDSPALVKNTKEREKHRVVILLSTNLPASAGTLPQTGAPAYRIQIANAYVTRYVPSFDGKIYSAEMTIKWVPFTKDGTGNKYEESTDGTVLLPAAGTSATAIYA